LFHLFYPIIVIEPKYDTVFLEGYSDIADNSKIAFPSVNEDGIGQCSN
jgi:hypothetical protein